MKRPPGVLKRSGLSGRLSSMLGRPGPTPDEWAHAVAKRLAREHWFSEIQGIGASLVHAHFGTNAGEVWPLAIALRLPMAITLHGVDIATRVECWESGQESARMRSYPSIMRAMAADGAVFIAVSEAIRESAIEFGLPPSAIFAQPIGIDIDDFAPGTTPFADRPSKIVFIGRLVAKKGCDLLLRAFVEVKLQLPQAELVVVGDGELQDQLQELARSLGVPVQFKGRMDAAQVLQELRSARVLCAPSIRLPNGDSEGLPTVVVEAQAAGIPVVTSARGGVSEGIRDGETGFAFEEGNIIAMSRHLIRLLEDPGLAEQFGAAARRFAKERFDIRARTAELETLYDKIAGRGTGHA